jgi:hypothetical protein
MVDPKTAYAVAMIAVGAIGPIGLSATLLLPPERTADSLKAVS